MDFKLDFPRFSRCFLKNCLHLVLSTAETMSISSPHMQITCTAAGESLLPLDDQLTNT